MLELVDVELRQGRFTFQGSLRLEQPVTGVFGPSGAGKSTLLKLIAGLAVPRAGRVVLDGETLSDPQRHIHVPPHRRRIGLVFQDSQMFPHLSVRHNLLYGWNLLSPARRRFQLPQILDLLDIGHLLRRRPRHLSGGEKQRVALGRTLLASPRLLLLDEPLASLDEGLKQQILPFLRRVRDELEIPMLYVSHAINEILALTPQLVVIEQGRVLGQGPLLDVIRRDNILALARSLGLENVVPVEIHHHVPAMGYTAVRFNSHELHLPLSELPAGTRLYASLRATDLALARSPHSDLTIQNQIPGTITALRHFNDWVLVEVDVGVRLQVEVTPKAVQDLRLAVGESVYCLSKVRAWSYLGS